MTNSLFLASKSHSSLSPASSLKCLSMLMGTIVLRDSFPVVATDSFVISPILFTFNMVNIMVVAYKFTYYTAYCTAIKFIRLFIIW